MVKTDLQPTEIPTVGWDTWGDGDESSSRYLIPITPQLRRLPLLSSQYTFKRIDDCESLLSSVCFFRSETGFCDYDIVLLLIFRLDRWQQRRQRTHMQVNERRLMQWSSFNEVDKAYGADRKMTRQTSRKGGKVSNQKQTTVVEFEGTLPRTKSDNLTNTWIKVLEVNSW